MVVVPAGPWWVGDDESRARSGAERRCARLSARASHREILANRRQMRRGPRPAFSLMAATVERAKGAARSAAEGADTEGQKMRNRWQIRQGPRRCPSLNVATVETEGRWEGWGLCEARRGAPPPLYRAVDEKFPKSTSNAPRSARESLADGRDMYP
ncbi:hypothetical protein EV715DRAFT_292038 [Schizophyllum commune]